MSGLSFEHNDMALPELQGSDIANMDGGMPDGTTGDVPEYGSLKVAVLSAILEQGGVVDVDGLGLKLGEAGIRRTQIRDGIAALTRKKLIQQTDGNVEVNQDGVSYLSAWCHMIDGAHQEAQKRIHFPKSAYATLVFFEAKAAILESDWLFNDSNQEPIISDLAQELGVKEENFARRLRGYQADGFIELRKVEEKGVDRSLGRPRIINIKLTETGRDELAEIREIYPTQIAEFNMRDTVLRMEVEINHMHYLLGEAEQEFDDPESLKSDDLPAVIKSLKTNVRRLENRINATDPSLLASVVLE